jgi:hypothetical protein
MLGEAEQEARSLTPVRVEHRIVLLVRLLNACFGLRGRFRRLGLARLRSSLRLARLGCCLGIAGVRRALAGGGRLCRLVIACFVFGLFAHQNWK